MVTNPSPLSCRTHEDHSLVDVSSPIVDRVRNQAFCRDAPNREIMIDGAGFLAFGAAGNFTAVPRVVVAQGATAFTFENPVPSNGNSVRPSGCMSIARIQ